MRTLPMMLLASLATLVACASVDAGEKGVVTTFGAPSTSVYEPGLHFVPPWSSMRRVDVRAQSEVLDTSAYFGDNQTVHVSINVVFRVNDVHGALFEINGPVWEAHVAQKVASSFKNVVGVIDAPYFMAHRSDLEEQVKDALIAEVGDLVYIDALNFTNIDYDDTFEAAVQAKFTAQQAAETAKFAQAKAEAQAKAAVTAAQGEADAVKIRAEANAEALRLQATAIAADPRTVQLEWIKKWDGKLPATTLGENTSTMINLK